MVIIGVVVALFTLPVGGMLLVQLLNRLQDKGDARINGRIIAAHRREHGRNG